MRWDITSSGIVSDEMTSELRPESHVSVWRKSVLHRKNSKCKSPEVRMCLVHKAHQGDNIIRAEGNQAKS